MEKEVTSDVCNSRVATNSRMSGIVRNMRNFVEKSGNVRKIDEFLVLLYIFYMLSGDICFSDLCVKKS